ncbi:MAG: MBL fold metallo-hydrolase [Candidatus Marinimicrobia bacterium]|nr:MBL fold metallo-hydrolase [Candidatus Neomarinimicrobiota bacterium]
MIGTSIAVSFGVIAIYGILFLNLSPQFGSPSTEKQKDRYAKHENFKDGKFTNQHASPMDVNYLKMIKELTRKAPNRNPAMDIPVEKIDSMMIERHDSTLTELTWFGHSTFLLQMDGKIILIDPMFNNRPSPHPWFGVNRYSESLPIDIESLPFIDAVIISHDHYDHLDYGSILKLKGRVGQYFTPLGLGNHLLKWGVSEEIIHELNWWDSIQYDGIKLVCTPARHMSGRGLLDRNSTLWCSWVIKGKTESIYFSGDGGYDTHFAEIGEKYGPFDISLMECGQYDLDWKLLHLMPEETAQASVDLKSKLILPIHWGGFTLAFHDWTDPIERVLKKADELNISVTTPKIGEPVILGNTTFPNEEWWKKYNSRSKN